MRLQQGAPADAARLCRAVLRHSPRQAHAHYLLGMALRMQDRHKQALQSFEDAFACGLADAAAYYQFGRLLLDFGDAERAEAEFRRAIGAKPDFALAYRDLGNLLYETGRFEESADCYRTAVRMDPSDWSGWHNLAHALYRLDRFDEAIATMDRAISRSPKSPELHAIQATLFELDHNIEAAEQCAQRALNLAPGFSSALVVLAKLAMRKDDPRSSLAYLDSADRRQITERQSITWYAERGRAFDRLGNYAEAFNAYTKSGDLLSRQTGFVDDTDLRSERLGRIEATFAKHPIRNISSLSSSRSQPQPVFVLGFMRAGTTLIERILGAHPEVFPAGELKFVAEAASDLEQRTNGDVGALLHSSEPAIVAALEEERHRYLTRVLSMRDDWDGCRFFVDKAPFNAEHIGLIRTLFPHAPIIRAVRHPLDIVLSCYFENFLEPNAWSRSLSSAAQWYARLHDHTEYMRQLFPERMEACQYEHLVADATKVTARLLEFVGLPWNDDCLRFHERARGVRTASYEQVSRPIYGDSVYRFRNYLPYIDDHVVERLRPAMEAFNYDLGSTDSDLNTFTGA